MPTIKDVAALAGVSYTTVSHVINNSRPVSQEARVRVEAAIEKLNYLPSTVARSLRHNVTSTIGLLISNSTNPFFSELARGIEDTCYRNSYSVILCNSDDDPLRQETYLRVLLQRRIDGLIVGSTGHDPFLASRLREAGIPVVIVDRPLPELDADVVLSDHYLGGRLAAQYLIEQGHRLIAFIGGPLDSSPTIERLDGFQSELQKSGIQLHSVLEADFTTEGGYKAARRLLKALRPTALFAGNDMIAIGALRYAAEQGIRVPDKLSLIGFDGIELGRYVHPALTTIDQSIRELGEIATATLIRVMAADTKPACKHHLLQPRLLIRESVGPGPLRA
jgi:LacI family transcriptional regulator